MSARMVTGFRFSESMIQVLDAHSTQGSIGQDDKISNRTAVLESAFAHYLYDLLKKEKVRQKVPAKKWKPHYAAALNKFPEGIFELYLEENQKRKSVDLLTMDTAVLESFVVMVDGKYTTDFLTDEQRELILAELKRRGVVPVDVLTKLDDKAE